MNILKNGKDMPKLADLAKSVEERINAPAEPKTEEKDPSTEPKKEEPSKPETSSPPKMTLAEVFKSIAEFEKKTELTKEDATKLGDLKKNLDELEKTASEAEKKDIETNKAKVAKLVEKASKGDEPE